MHYAFSSTGITSVTIPNGVTHIGDYAFQFCESLTSVIIPNSVTGIGDHAFYGCSELKAIVIPDKVEQIGYGAFYRCYSLMSIKYRGTQEEWNAISKGTRWNYDTGSYTITYNYQG